ncbi:hypothetical protein AOLI_G00093310 [Acnodon oligacanthus]
MPGMPLRSAQILSLLQTYDGKYRAAFVGLDEQTQAIHLSDQPPGTSPPGQRKGVAVPCLDLATASWAAQYGQNTRLGWL